MVQNINLSVVIPVYNEVELITELYERLANVLKTIPGRNEIVFVDDGSRDGSLAAVVDANSDAYAKPSMVSA